MKLVKEGRKPSDLITKEVLLNAIMFDMAVAGSTNAVLHLLSYGYELGIKLTLEDFERYADEIYCINAVVPSGPYTVVDFHYAGGVMNVMKMLESKLFIDVPSMYGCTWKELLSKVTPKENEVIHSLERPLFHEPGLKILRGNLSPNGAIVRPTAVYEEVKYLKGKAKVFEGDRPAFEAIQAGDIVPGDLIVIRYEGCKGAPGMKELMLSIDALIGLGLHKSVGLITDARFSGFNYGAIIGHVSPEAYDGGTIALGENGDEIVIDSPNGEVNLLVSEEELTRRKADWVCPPLKEEKGWLNIYAKMCRPAEEGGAMQPWALDARFQRQDTRRTGGSAMLLLSREDIKKVFTMKDAVEADKEAFRLVVEGKCDAPIRTNIQAPKHEGSFLFMPAYVEEMDTASLKVVDIFPHNIDQGLPTSPAQVFLIDGKNGIVKAVLDGTYVTQVRTGAATGAAFDLLAKKDCRIGALIGTGGQAAAQLEAMLTVRKLEEVRVFDMNPERAQAFAATMQEELEEYGAKIVAAVSSDEAVEGADLLVTVTPSSRPVFDASKVKEGATVSCVGAYQPHMQEMDPAILTRASKIYFDSEEAVLSESGDILIPLADGTITKEDFTGDLGQLIKGQIPGRESDEEIIVFETVGVAAQDLMAAKAIYDRAVEAGIGMNWE